MGKLLSMKMQEIMTAIQTFYENLYSSDFSHSSRDFYEFGRDLQFAKLSDEEMLNLDGEITLEECEKILNTFQNGKSPGADSYTGEFYKQFFSLLGQDLVNSFNAAFDIGKMSVSQRRGVITLLPKEDSNLLLLSNWCPITLLSGSPAKSGPPDFGTKNNFPSFFVSEKGLVHRYKNATYYFTVLYFSFATSQTRTQVADRDQKGKIHRFCAARYVP